MIKFYEKRNIFFIISILIFVIGIISVFTSGLNLDISFKGGAIIKYTYDSEIDVNAVEDVVKNTLGRNVSIQTTNDLATGENKIALNLAGNEGISAQEQKELDDALKEKFENNNLELSESNIVEPFIGKRFLQNGILAIIVSAILIVFYVWIRFSKISGLSAGVMALVALLHDCLMVFFVFAIFKLPINESFIAVILTIIGYSINDTIIIYDRIRENALLSRKYDVVELVNISINQSLSRSINTTLTTIISVIILLVFAYVYGIESIVIFALPMAIGMLSGSYSSICLAGPLWVMWQKKRQKLII